ncbi:Hypothetical protein MVR_LOCUS32 [uncultured virus]|nr:Hypothetical protein MVR_LOCUS32 [uncultured virus]
MADGNSGGCGILLILVLLFIIGVVGWLIWDSNNKKNRRVIQGFKGNINPQGKSVLNIQDPRGEGPGGRLSEQQCNALITDLRNLNTEFHNRIGELKGMIEPYAAQNTTQAAEKVGGALGNASNQFNGVVKETSNRLTKLFNNLLNPQQRARITNFLKKFNGDIEHFNSSIAPYTGKRVQQIAVPGSTVSPTPSISNTPTPGGTPSNIVISGTDISGAPVPTGTPSNIVISGTDITSPVYINQLDCNEYFTDDGGYCSGMINGNQYCYNLELDNEGQRGEFARVDPSYCTNGASCKDVGSMCGAF